MDNGGNHRNRLAGQRKKNSTKTNPINNIGRSRFLKEVFLQTH